MTRDTKLFVIAGLLVAAGLALFVSPLASNEPDGLERVAADRGFDEAADDHALDDSPVADYGLRGVGDERLATALAGVVGVLVTFGLGLGAFALVRSLRPADDAEPEARQTGALR